MSTRHVIVSTTTPTREAADSLAAMLVGERAAACVQVLGPISSVYRWKGQVQSATEVALIAKTRADLVEKLTERVLSLHSYECPCIVSLSLEGGNPAFLRWITTETGSTEP